MTQIVTETIATSGQEAQLKTTQLLHAGVTRTPSVQKSFLTNLSVSRNKDFFDRTFYVYELRVPGIATIFLAVNRESVDSPSSLVQPDWNDIHCATELPPKLDKKASYGGSRLVPPSESRQDAMNSLVHLAFFESSLKHALINRATENGALNALVDEYGRTQYALQAENLQQRGIPVDYQLPKPYLNLRFKGGRCIIYPDSQQAYERLSTHSREEIAKIFSAVGKFLNGRLSANIIDLQGNIKQENAFIPPGSFFLTPDFGTNSRLADCLNDYTPHVLGISPEAGGGSGKSSYTVSGILGALKACLDAGLIQGYNPCETPITLIGSAGSLGGILTQHFIGHNNVRVCDTKYDSSKGIKVDTVKSEQIISLKDGSSQRVPLSWKVILAEEGRFTREALTNGGVIIATTYGKELEHSDYNSIPEGSLLLLAHNFSIPEGNAGIQIAEGLQNNGVWAFPGQLLTLGGAANSRLEIAHRASKGIAKINKRTAIEPFPKRLGHEINRLLAHRIVSDTIAIAREQNMTLQEAMMLYIEADLK